MQTERQLMRDDAKKLEQLAQNLKRKQEEMELESSKLKLVGKQIENEKEELNAERIKLNEDRMNVDHKRMSRNVQHDQLEGIRKLLETESAFQRQSNDMLRDVIEVKKALETERERLGKDAWKLEQRQRDLKVKEEELQQREAGLRNPKQSLHDIL